MKWHLTDDEKGRIRACLQEIEYSTSCESRRQGLVRLKGFLDGDRTLSHGIAKHFHSTLFPLLYSVFQDCGKGDDDGKCFQRLSLSILHEIVGLCSRKQISFLLVTDRFKSLVSRVEDADHPTAGLTCRVVAAMLKIEDGIKDLFWEMNQHQLVQRALAKVLAVLRKEETTGGISVVIPHLEGLVELLFYSAANVRHRQELYGSGYALCTALAQTVEPLMEKVLPDEPQRATLLIRCAEQLALGLVFLVRENRLNQDSFRQEPNLQHLKVILGPIYDKTVALADEPGPPQVKRAASDLKLALETLSLLLQVTNDSISKLIKTETPRAALQPPLHEFAGVLLEGLENLRRHHYDVDVVVRSLGEIEAFLVDSGDTMALKNYIFRHTYGAWPLLFSCLNNIDERIMFQACCLTAKLVRNSTANQTTLIDMDGIETLSEILGDYNLDIQLVGMQILDALKDSGTERMKKEVGDPCITEHLLRIVRQFPEVFKEMLSQQPNFSSPPTPTPSVTTPLNPNPYDLSKLPNLEKQVSIVQYALSLIGDTVVHCPNTKAKFLEMSGERALLQLLSYSYTHCFTFYSKVKSGNGERHPLKLPRAQTAPGPRLKSGSVQGQSAMGAAAPSATETPLEHEPASKISVIYIKILLGVVESTCRSLSNIVRHCLQAQWSVHKHGGTDMVLNYLTSLLVFGEDCVMKHDHDAWCKRQGEDELAVSLPTHTIEALQKECDGDDHPTGSAVATSNGANNGTGSPEVYPSQNGYLVGPDLVASLLLLLVNTVESNNGVQTAMKDSRLRNLLHHLLTHPSPTVVNTAQLLITHLSFDNKLNQKYFSTPYTIQRLLFIAATSYFHLVQGGETLWNSSHLHLLSPPSGTDPTSFYSFQSLAYSLVCIGNLVQRNHTLRGVLFQAKIKHGSETIPWLQLISHSLLLPVYPIQDGALTLLSNLLCEELDDDQLAHLLSLKIVDCLFKTVCLDCTDNDSGDVCQPCGPNDGYEAEVRWLSNKAFQLMTTLRSTSTQVVMSHIHALIKDLNPYPDIAPLAPVEVHYRLPDTLYKEYDSIDVYNTLTQYVSVLNGLCYSCEQCRRYCLLHGGIVLLSKLVTVDGLDIDLKVCALCAMANLVSHCAEVPPRVYADILESHILNSLSKVILDHHLDPEDDDELPAEHKEHVTEFKSLVFQIAHQVLLQSSSSQIDGKTPRLYIATEYKDLLELLVQVGLNDTDRLRVDALSFLLAICEEDAVPPILLSNPAAREVLVRARKNSDGLSYPMLMLVDKHLGAAPQP